jgi:hypothetical protein
MRVLNWLQLSNYSCKWVVAIVPISTGTAETCPKFEPVAGLLELDITLDIVGDGDENTIEMEEV